MRDRFEVTTTNTNGKFGVLDIQEPDEEIRIITICDREAEAMVLVDKLNEMQKEINEKPLNLQEDFAEWDYLIQEIPQLENQLRDLKEDLFKKQLEEDKNTDYKSLYGKNNEKIREVHYKETFFEIYEKIYSISQDTETKKRRISFIREMIRMKIELLKTTAGAEI